jgi:chemotaxis receptor (MCP) glutamine deamidase CheD
MYGGAESTIPRDVYNIGKKNIEAVRSALIQMGLAVHKADLHGFESRTISLHVKTGAVTISRQPIAK